MTAAEKFVKRMLGGITSSSDMSPNSRDDGNGGNADAAIDAAITYLDREGDESTRRNVFAKDWALKESKKKGETSVSAQDELYEALVEDADALNGKTLAEHDKERHPNGYHEGDTCKFREEMMVETDTDKADEVDAKNRESGTKKTAEQPRQTENNGNQGDGGKPQVKVYEGLSNKKVEKYKSQMAKKHPELDADLILTELAKIKDPKLQGDAFAWVMKGAIKLPEDMYKVEQARELATKAKKDPLQWDTPQACINELLGEGHRVKEKPITVQELKKSPLMSNYRDEGYGVETFQVEDSKEGQKLMRQVIDTHWGKDANPWCLLARDNRGSRENTDDYNFWLADRHSGHEHDDFWMEYYAEGNRANREKDEEDYRSDTGKEPFYQLRNAWKYWQHYSSLPKRVAFKDGKLLAFMATDEKSDISEYEDLVEHWDERSEWFNITFDTDFEDAPTLEEWAEATGEKIEEPPEQWWDRQDSPHEGIPLGETEIPDDELHRRVEMGELKDGEITIPKGMKKYIGREGERGYRAWNDANTSYEDIGFGYTVRSEDVPSRELRRQLKNLWIGILHRGGDFSIGKIIGMFDDEFRLQAMMDGDGKPITEKDESYPQYSEELSDLISAFHGANKKESKNVSDELVSALVGDAFVSDESLPQGETLQEHDRKHHKGHFDPSTQTCKYREEMAVETDADKADIADEDRESKGNKKDSAEHSQPLVSPEEDKAYMEAVKRGDMETAARMVREVAARAFPNTKVVDEDGLPQIVFHGSKSFGKGSSNSRFIFKEDKIGSQTDFGVLGKGFYFSAFDDLASHHGDITKVFLDIQKPYYATMEEFWDGFDTAFNNESAAIKIREKIEAEGCDGVVKNRGVRKKDEIVAFKASQIKSADPVTYDDDGNVIPLSRRFDDGDDIRGDIRGNVSGSSPSESNGEEFGESFYASVYPDRDESFSAEFAPVMEEESRKADESYAANFSKDGTYKLPFANGRFGKGIMDKVREEQKKQAEGAKRQEEEQKRFHTPEGMTKAILDGMDSLSVDDAEDILWGIKSNEGLFELGYHEWYDRKQHVAGRLKRFGKKRAELTERFVASALTELAVQYPAIKSVLGKAQFVPCPPAPKVGYAAVQLAYHSGELDSKFFGELLQFPYGGDEIEGKVIKKIGQWKKTPFLAATYAPNATLANRMLLMHEVGHLVFDRRTPTELQKSEVQWKSIIEKGEKETKDWQKKISRYAQTNNEELHSECFALYTMPDYGTNPNLPKLPKAVEQYLEKELQGTLDSRGA